MEQFVRLDNIHILVIWTLAEKRALPKHPIKGEKWFMGIKSHVFFIDPVYCSSLISG